jgi:uncharacterized membrane protein YphA (DoxX/SURF4 family)
MEASTTAPPLPHQLELPAWKSIASHLGAVVVAFLFLIAGVYKAVDPYKFAALANNLLVPFALTLPLAVALSIAETTAGVLILVPRFRRWGALLAGGLLLVFMGYIGWNYSALIGRDCSCFPELKLPFGLAIDLKRSVGPGFFWGDGAFLVAAALAGLWAKPSAGLRTATVILGAVAVFSGVSFGVAYANQNGVQAPESIVVDGKPMSLREGRFFLFFYNPACTHCQAAAANMSKLRFKPDVTVVAIPVGEQQWAQAFLDDAKFTVAHTSLESEKLRQTFKFEYPPYGYVIERGRQTGMVPQYDEGTEVAKNAEPETTLRQLGVIE